MTEYNEHKLVVALLNNYPAVGVCLQDNPIDWWVFYKLVLRHRVWYQVYTALQSLDIPIITTLSAYCRQDALHILKTIGETVIISRNFTQLAIEHCFVKGMVLNVHLYKNINDRTCRDIDVWVDLEHYAAAIQELLQLGYKQQAPTYELAGAKQRWHMRHQHDMSFYHVDKHIFVELHFRLSYFWLDFFPMSEIKKSTVALFNTPVITLDDDYHVLYLMMHGSIHAFIRLRWLQDIALFINNKQCNLQNVYTLALQIKCEHVVEQTLILLHNNFKLQQVELLAILQNSSRLSVQIANIAQKFIESPYEMTDGICNIKMFLTYRLYLVKLAVKGKKLSAMFSDLCKLQVVFKVVRLPDKLFFIYYLMYPLWVIKYIFKA